MDNPINTPEGKTEFIRDLTSNVVKSILAKVPEMPAEWDGHELREYLADEFARNRSALMREPRSRRLRDYRNTVNVTGGL